MFGKNEQPALPRTEQPRELGWAGTDGAAGVSLRNSLSLGNSLSRPSGDSLDASIHLDMALIRLCS